MTATVKIVELSCYFVLLGTLGSNSKRREAGTTKMWVDLTIDPTPVTSIALLVGDTATDRLRAAISHPGGHVRNSPPCGCSLCLELRLLVELGFLMSHNYWSETDQFSAWYTEIKCPWFSRWDYWWITDEIIGRYVPWFSRSCSQTFCHDSPI